MTPTWVVLGILWTIGLFLSWVFCKAAAISDQQAEPILRAVPPLPPADECPSCLLHDHSAALFPNCPIHEDELAARRTVTNS